MNHIILCHSNSSRGVHFPWQPFKWIPWHQTTIHYNLKTFLWGHWYLSFGLVVTYALDSKARMVPLACVLPRLRANILAHPTWKANLFNPRTFSNISRVPTRTGKPGKMGRHFPVREKSGNFDDTGKVSENHIKYWKTE